MKYKLTPVKKIPLQTMRPLNAKPRKYPKKPKPSQDLNQEDELTLYQWYLRR